MLNSKNRKKDVKKKNHMATNSNSQIESSVYVNEKIVCTSLQKEVNLSSLHNQE